MKILRSRRLARANRLLLGLLLLGIAWVCKPQLNVTAQMAEQRFFTPESWAREMTNKQGWGPEHPRLLADVNGDGKQDIMGFDNDGVWLAVSTGTSFNPAFVLANFGYNQGWRVAEHVRTAAAVNGDGKQDIVGFGNDGVWIALSAGNGFGPP